MKKCTYSECEDTFKCSVHVTDDEDKHNGAADCADGSDGNDVGDDDVIKGAWALTSAHLSESIYDSCLTLLK